jgi:hypothetical protein
MYLIPHVATLYSVLKRVYHEEFIQAPDNITQYIQSMAELNQEDNCVRFLFSIGFLSYHYNL